jgi:signal transduction histidine kinase
MADVRFPLLRVLEAVLGWQREPDDARLDSVAGALGGLVSSSNIRGARLEADQATLPGLSVGWGTLAEGVAPETRCVELEAADGGQRIGALWIDSPTEPPDEVVRAAELALGVAASQAEVQRTAARLEALDAATRGIASLVSLDRVLQLIVDRVRELIGAEYAALGTVDGEGLIERFVTSGLNRAEREAIGPLPRGHGLLGLIIREGTPLRVPDIAMHPDSYGFPPHHPPMHSLLGVPIRVSGEIIGDFYLTNKRGAAEFTDDDQRLVEMFALHAGVAIQNARLHEQVQRLVVADERIRIGNDLHDGIIQGIYAVGLSLEDVPDLMRTDPDEAAARVDRSIDALNLAIRDIRNFIFGLQPDFAGQAGLVAGAAALVNELRVNSIIDVELTAGDALPDPGEFRRTELLKILREALSNVARHSKAARASVLLGADDRGVRLTITDNGVGFPVDEDRGAEHHGLRNMRARAADLGGTFDMESSRAGTTITVRIPTQAAEPEPTAPTGGDL